THGAALVTVWRGWPVDVAAHLFSYRGNRGGELRGTWSAEFPLARVKIAAGTRFGPSFLETRFDTRQRKVASERLELAADSARHLRATARAAVRVAGFELAGAVTEGRRMSVGGAATSVEPASLFIPRVLDPALDRDALFGRYRGQRAELRSGPVAAFWQRHRTNRTVDVFGLEGTLNRDPLPIVKAPGL